MKSKFYLVGGNGEIVQNKVLPDVTDDEIEKLYKDMIKDDPDHAKFKGSKREYVKKLYDRMKLFMDIQDAFYNEKKKRKMKGGMVREEEDVKEPEGELKESKEESEIESERTNLLDVLESYTELDVVPTELYRIVFDDEQPSGFTSSKPITTLREIIKSEKITYASIEHVRGRFKKFAASFLKAIERNTLPAAERIKRNILNLLMFPYISDWNHYGGLGTEQLRTFAGIGKDQTYITNIQSKYGEYLIKADKTWMKSMGFKQDFYKEGTFLLRSCDLFESDIFDLQQIKNNKIYMVGEVKTFFTGRPLQLQKTKLTIMAKIYNYVKTPVGGAGGDELSISGHTFVKSNFTDAKNIPVILFYIDQNKSRTPVRLNTTEVIPIRIEFDGFKIIEYFKKNYEEIYDQMISLDLDEYYEINARLRIVKHKKKKGESKLLPGVAKNFDFKIKDLFDSGCIKHIIQTLDGSTVVLPDTPDKSEVPFPPFSKIPSEGFTTYNYRLPKNKLKTSSTTPYKKLEILENQYNILKKIPEEDFTMANWIKRGAGSITQINSTGHSVAGDLAKAIHDDFNISRIIGDYNRLTETSFRYNKKQIDTEFLLWAKYAASEAISYAENDTASDLKIKSIKEWRKTNATKISKAFAELKSK